MTEAIQNMFCNQCEQAAKGTGCTISGVCGKNPEVSALQDLLVHSLRWLAPVALAAGQRAENLSQINGFVEDALFTTLTNVDFDPETIAAKVDQAVAFTVGLGGTTPAVPADIAGKVALGRQLGTPWDRTREADVQSLQEVTLYGLKGVSAYAHHARTLGHSDDAIDTFLFRALDSIGDTSLDLGAWVGLALETGAINLRTMEILDEANTGTYGQPAPTKVPLGHRRNRAILVSGHDLADIAKLLELTEGKDVDIYTHGEMLPTHAYPELKKYPHFFGHFGTAWQNQHKEFAAFPGAILMTTNCLMPPKDEYRDRIFTAGVVNFPGIPHVGRDDFSAIVERALELPGFIDTVDAGEVMVGFGHNTILSVAPTVIEAVKTGAIRHFFLVGGCDGAKPGRNYYTDLVEATPSDTVVLTLACGKFRFFDKDLGEIGGLPRLMDVGQCNDAYSAIKVAAALADAFGTDVNGLPLSMVLSWYEQKAVAILLTLFHLGVKDIRLGPTLPAFISPGVLNVLVENFGIRPIAPTAADDLREILGTGEAA